MTREHFDASEIAELLPAIMRGLHGDRPVPTGLRDLTLVQMRALGTIGEADPCTMGQLAGALHISLGAATGLVDRLIAHGLVQREADPRDRRVVRLRVTEGGRRAHAVRRREVRRRLARALEAMPPEQRQQLVESLTRLRDALGELPQ
jgi:DNA-binding MarR family transcriptional regulator